jgi:imidazole glycerol-phosphate synthase subunit HisH
MTSVAVVDYGMGNLRSVAKALERVAPQARVKVTASASEIAAADRVVVPGQGAMPDCMRELDARGLRDSVISAAASKPFLGICIGLQMLFGESEEGDSQTKTRGLDILSGRVPRFPASAMQIDGKERLKVPHMGWNNVNQNDTTHPLWTGIANQARFYFVHSFFVEPEESVVSAATSDYGIRFTSAVCRDNIFAVQFHPEKSAQAGLQLLGNFMRWTPH